MTAGNEWVRQVSDEIATSNEPVAFIQGKGCIGDSKSSTPVRDQNEEVSNHIIDLGSDSPAEQSRGFRNLGKWLRSNCRTMRGRHADAPDDVSDELVTNLLAKLASSGKTRRMVLDADNPAALLRAMFRRAQIDDHRKRRGIVPLSDVHTTGLADASDQIEDADIRDAVSSALAALSEEQRTLLRLYFWEGLSLGEIACRLDIKYASREADLPP